MPNYHVKTEMTMEWFARDTDEGVYVQEHVSGQQGFVEYGPLPPGTDAEKFVDERRVFFERMVSTISQELAKRKIPWLL
jgi:hypothetical protein